MMAFTSVRVFSATMHEDRANLGERITQWLTEKAAAVDIVEIVQRQSSDSRFHMISIIFFYNEVGKHRIDHAIKGPQKGDVPVSTSSRRLDFKDR
jgi:hypothetical protein